MEEKEKRESEMSASENEGANTISKLRFLSPPPCLFRRLNQPVPAWPACAEVVLGQDRFSPLGSRLCPGQLYLRTNRCPPRVSAEKSIEGSRLRGRHLRHS
ncbi:unnamed protein product [Lupinus luteus]|uniref:Uncharacterized protein n=1 Tax=Lupinus luteus TaxID=3873 RepID=A0AAV1XS30_LUPLU